MRKPETLTDIQCIGKKIKEIRVHKNLKQTAIANALGLSTTAYGDIERGKTINISIQRLGQIAEILKVTMYELLV